MTVTTASHSGQFVRNLSDASVDAVEAPCPEPNRDLGSAWVGSYIHELDAGFGDKTKSLPTHPFPR